MSILITGVGGFIGFHLAKRLLKEDIPVIGYDNLNSYYDLSLKISRIEELKKISKIKKIPFLFLKKDLESFTDLEKAFKGIDNEGNYFVGGNPNKVIHKIFY